MVVFPLVLTLFFCLFKANIATTLCLMILRQLENEISSEVGDGSRRVFILHLSVQSADTSSEIGLKEMLNRIKVFITFIK